jgi:hypothetical protein
VSEEASVVGPPANGLWRVARGDNPLWIPNINLGAEPDRANRFDPHSMSYRVLYFGSSLEVCFGETLARFRPSIPLLALIADEWEELGFMTIGSVAADWRQRRTAVHVRLPSTTRFLDVDSPETHQVLRKELARELSAIGIADLDVSTVRGPNRQITQLISEWAYMAADGNEPRYAGIRYESRIRSGWECWALFDDEDLELEIVESLPISPDMPELGAIAELFRIQIF